MTVGLHSTNLVHPWLNMLRGVAFTAPAGSFMKLHTGDPGSAGTANASANTTRVSATFSAAAAGTLTLSNNPSWASWAAGSETISHVSEWDASTGGSFLYSWAFGVPQAITNGGTLNVTSHTVALTPLAA